MARASYSDTSVRHSESPGADPILDRRGCASRSPPASWVSLRLKRFADKSPDTSRQEQQPEGRGFVSLPSQRERLLEPMATTSFGEIEKNDSLADLSRPLSPKGKVGHVTSEVFLIVRLAIKLWSYLGLGWRWTWNCLRLVVYALILMPGFLQMVFYYFFSPQVRRSVIYGRKPRNRLDLYYPTTPPQDEAGWPVVIFITGGAWTIGYKAWGALLGRRLSEQGILVASLDYRNFPQVYHCDTPLSTLDALCAQGSCQDMLEDINTGINWVIHKIHGFGGDSKNVYLCGQSAGGHLAAVAMLTQVMPFMTPGLREGRAWDPQHLRGFVGVSAAYSLPDLADHLDRRGLYKSMFKSIMSIDGESMLETLSPIHIAKELKPSLSSYLPEVLLLHGKLDSTLPFQRACDGQEAGVDCRFKLYDGKTHTQPLIEDPLKGGRDCLLEDIVNIVHHLTFLLTPYIALLDRWRLRSVHFEEGIFDSIHSGYEATFRVVRAL